MLFEFDKTEGRTRFKFKDFVQNKDMKVISFECLCLSLEEYDKTVP